MTGGALMVAGHVLMPASMLAVMLRRRDHPGCRRLPGGSSPITGLVPAWRRRSAQTRSIRTLADRSGSTAQ